jgi:hypothetical protein
MIKFLIIGTGSVSIGYQRLLPFERKSHELRRIIQSALHTIAPQAI